MSQISYHSERDTLTLLTFENLFSKAYFISLFRFLLNCPSRIISLHRAYWEISKKNILICKNIQYIYVYICTSKMLFKIILHKRMYMYMFFLFVILIFTFIFNIIYYWENVIEKKGRERTLSIVFWVSNCWFLVLI